MKLSVNQKCILAFIAGMLVCCMYKRYTTLEGMQLPAMLVGKKGEPDWSKVSRDGKIN